MASAKSKQVIVMTGATAGLGAHALAQLARTGARIFVGARGREKPVPPGVELLPLDLASLKSVRDFATMLVARIGAARINVLILNAGIQSREPSAASEDGFALVFAVNHLAHYLLARLLLPYMSEGGRIVITTSDTHDPSVTPLGPRELNIQALSRPGESASGVRAYAASKLCNVLTVYGLLDTQEVADRALEVVAFNPGLTGGTSLGRDASPAAKLVVRLLMGTIYPVIGLFNPIFVMSTAERSGEQLARTALGEISPPRGSVYVSLVKGEPTFPQPSELAQNRNLQDQLWRQSADMVGLSP